MEAGVLVEQLLGPVPGGTGRYTQDLLAALESSRSTGRSVTYWSAYHRGLPGNSDLPSPCRRLPLGRRALSEAWSWGVGPSPHADVIHAPTLLAPARRDVPVVVTVHDDVPWTHPHTLTRHGARWHRRMGTRIAREADALVVPTKAVADRLAGCFPGERANRIVVIPNPLPVNRFRRLSASSPGDDDRAARLGLPAEGFLLFVGTQEPRKGLDVLLSALKEPGGPRLPLLLVGPQGWGGVQIGSRDGRVRALGRLDEDDLAVSYRRATVVVLPSRAEGFGYPVVEAMAAGTAVVTSDEPALMETAGGAALTAPIGDAPALANVLRRVERDEVLRAELSGRGRERVRDFNPDDYGRRMWELYDAVSG